MSCEPSKSKSLLRNRGYVLRHALLDAALMKSVCQEGGRLYLFGTKGLLTEK